MVDKQELLVTFVLELFIAILLYFVTSSLIFIIATLGIAVAIMVTVSMVRNYYNVHNMVGIKKLIDASKEDWLKCYTQSSVVRVLLRTGGWVLGTEKDSMYQTIEKLPHDYRGEIRILLLDPNSKHISDRAEELGLPIERVKAYCTNTIESLQFLKGKHNLQNLNWALYDDYSPLRFTLFDQFGIVAYGGFTPEQTRNIKIAPGKESLYESLVIYFDQLWNRYFKRQ